MAAGSSAAVSGEPDRCTYSRSDWDADPAGRSQVRTNIGDSISSKRDGYVAASTPQSTAQYEAHFERVFAQSRIAAAASLSALPALALGCTRTVAIRRVAAALLALRSNP